MKRTLFALTFALASLSPAWAADAPNLAPLPTSQAAVADTNMICGAGAVLDPVCVSSFATTADALLCPCVASNPMQITEYSVVVSNTSSVPTLTALLAQLSINTNGARFTADSKEGKRLVTTSFAALGSGVNELTVRRFDYANRVALALSLIPSGSGMTVKLYLVPKVITSGIDDTLQLARGGRRILVHGPLNCPAGQKVRKLWVTATQVSTGALAHAQWTGTCTGDTQVWNATAQLDSDAGQRFEAGPAQLCASAVFLDGHDPKSSKQWCVDAQLYEE